MERERATKFIHELLDLLVKQKGSDLFITSDFPPAIKVDGKISPVSKSQLTPQHTIELVRSVMNDKQAAEFEGSKECNFAISPPGIGRFRVNAFVQQGRVGMVLRTITTDIPKFEELGLPPVLRDIIMSKRGIMMFIGATGSRQVDVDGVAARLPQREQPRPHHHDRGPDRVRPPAPQLHRHAARSRRRLRRLAGRTQEHVAPGARRDPDRRSARARDDGLRDQLRGNRPPVPGDAAREQHEPGARPDHQLLPRGAPRAAADGPLAQLPRVRRAATDPAARRPRPGSRRSR